MIGHLDDDISRKMIEVRRLIHRRPELSNQEFATSALVRRELEAAGITGIKETAGTGIVADIFGRKSSSSRRIAMRADLDALPITEKAQIPFASENSGIMHACGHDAHTAMVLAAAWWLKRREDQFAGSVRCIFQPAEESEPLGGRRVVEEGHLNDVDGIIGIHVDPNIEAGRIGVRAGPYSLASDEFDIRILGKSAHGGRPHEGVDSIVIACSVVNEIQNIVSRERDPRVPLVMTIGLFQAGTGHNILADEALIRGTIRSGSEEVREMAKGRLTSLTKALACAHGGNAEIVIRSGEPVIMNDPAMVGIIERAGNQVGGAGTVYGAEPWTACDDFAFYTQHKPGVYFRLGVGNPAKGCLQGLHHPEFMLDEDALPLGAAVLGQAALLALATS